MRIGRQVIPQSLFVNLAAVGLAAFLGVWILGDYVSTDKVAMCSQRFAQGTLFATETRGRLLSPDELQARLQGSDLGLTENLEVDRLKNGPSTSILKVRLAPIAIEEANSASQRHFGTSFHWVPRRLPAAEGVCLTYSVRVPADFEYGLGGVLPSLTGGKSGDETASGGQTIVSKLQWRADGRIEMRLASEDGNSQVLGIDAGRLRLEKGKWVRIEQEMVMNKIGAKNGMVRVWIDDELRLEKGGLVLKTDPTTRFHGVNAGIGYTMSSRDVAKAPTKKPLIEVTPFEVRWP